MKPRYRPGKPATSGRSARNAIQKAKPLTRSQMESMKHEESASEAAISKVGKKGKRASWNIDYEEGVQYDSIPMPFRDPESLSIEGLRRRPKRKG